MQNVILPSMGFAILNAVMGFITPSEGELCGDGQCLSDFTKWRAKVAFVGQDPGMIAGDVADIQQAVSGWFEIFHFLVLWILYKGSES